jgi:flagellar biosynthesis/type III secretory pathway M-ring protein FliF/YscJ
VRWGSGVVAAVATDRVVTANGTTTSSTQQHLDGSTTTAVATPAGAIVGRSVAVAVDRSKLGSTSLASLSRLVGAAAGVVASRGDRVSIAVVRFARPAAPAAPAVTPVSLLLPSAVPAIWALGGIAALLILVRAVRGGRRRRFPAGATRLGGS